MTPVSIFRTIVTVTTILVSTLPAQAANLTSLTNLTNVTINFDEYAFPTTPTIGNGTQAYNLFDDATGSKLANNNGDGNDLTIGLSDSGAGALSKTGTPNLKIGGGKIVSDRAYTK